MQPSLDFCRTQEALQIRRAADSLLANVKTIATAAAAAWRAEGVLAERRENRRKDAAPRPAAVWDDRAVSENPDRGFSS